MPPNFRFKRKTNEKELVAEKNDNTTFAILHTKNENEISSVGLNVLDLSTSPFCQNGQRCPSDRWEIAGSH